MKKTLTLTILALSIAACLTSCLKDDKGTVLYSSQSIPDINTFMPARLLEMMGNENLHYGEEPPRMMGTFLADTLYIIDTSFINHTITTHSVNMGAQSYKAHFQLFEQKKGILKCNYTSPRALYNFKCDELSRVDSTYAKFDESSAPILNSAYKPRYFESGKLNLNDFDHAYLMGKDSLFTLYYYEALINDCDPSAPFTIPNYYPVVANIISGRLEKAQIVQTDPVSQTVATVTVPCITNFHWGKQVMGYFKEGSALQQLIAFGRQPTPGDTWVLDNHGRPVFQTSNDSDQ